VEVYDPEAAETAQRMFPTLTYADSLTEAAEDADALLVLTEWNEFSQSDPIVLGELVQTQTVIDARNCLDAQAWRAAGWSFDGLGTSSVRTPAVDGVGIDLSLRTSVLVAA